MPKVLVFTDKVLSPTQTFVQTQVELLRRYTPQYVGLSLSSPTLEVSGTPIIRAREETRTGYWKKELYKWVGIAPQFHAQIRDASGALVHAHFAENATAAMWMARAARLPLILSLHGGAEILPDKTLRRERYNLPFYIFRSALWKQARLFLCVSEFVRQKAMAHGFPPAKLLVHYTGIDLSKFLPSPKERDPNLVVYVGRLVRYKAADHFLMAMQRLRTTHPSARCVVIGEGPLRLEYERLAVEMNLDCKFLGHQPSPIVRDWIGKAAVFCAPSMTSLADGRSEALGHVFLEAQAMGVPVVSYQHGGIPEAVRHNVTGLLAREGDIEQLASYLWRCLESPLYGRTMGERGVQWIHAYFDAAKQNILLERIYESVCST